MFVPNCHFSGIHCIIRNFPFLVILEDFLLDLHVAVQIHTRKPCSAFAISNFGMIHYPTKICLKKRTRTVTFHLQFQKIIVWSDLQLVKHLCFLLGVDIKFVTHNCGCGQKFVCSAIEINQNQFRKFDKTYFATTSFNGNLLRIFSFRCVNGLHALLNEMNDSDFSVSWQMIFRSFEVV